MSKYVEKEITCPGCGHKQTEKLWESVNASLNPEMKEKIMSHDFFVFKCEECGKTIPLAYNCLYSDINKHEMIWLLPEVNNKLMKQINDAKTIQVDGKPFGAMYLDRVVSTPNELVEKILIFDEGFDDRIIELMKLIYMSQLGVLTGDETIMQEAISEMLFDANNGKRMFVIFFENRDPLTLDFNENVYLQIYEDYIDKTDTLTKPGYSIIDYEWAKKLLEETNGKGSMKQTNKKLN